MACNGIFEAKLISTLKVLALFGRLILFLSFVLTSPFPSGLTFPLFLYMFQGVYKKKVIYQKQTIECMPIFKMKTASSEPARRNNILQNNSKLKTITGKRAKRKKSFLAIICKILPVQFRIICLLHPVEHLSPYTLTLYRTSIFIRKRYLLKLKH